jgi:oxaloacetate decarboxylase alpha subunit
MVTPFPQMVVSQALFNVIGERWSNVPDQVIRYALGSFGRPTAPIAPDVLDRILDRPRARELQAEPPPPSPAELRRRFPGVSDEEMLLRAHMPEEQVDAMVAAGPAPRHFNPELAPVLTLLGELGSRTSVRDLTVSKPGLRLSVRRSSEGALGA